MEEGDEERENGERETADVSWGMADDAEDFPDMEQVTTLFYVILNFIQHTTCCKLTIKIYVYFHFFYF